MFAIKGQIIVNLFATANKSKVVKMQGYICIRTF